MIKISYFLIHNLVSAIYSTKLEISISAINSIFTMDVKLFHNKIGNEPINNHIHRIPKANPHLFGMVLISHAKAIDMVILNKNIPIIQNIIQWNHNKRHGNDNNRELIQVRIHQNLSAMIHHVAFHNTMQTVNIIDNNQTFRGYVTIDHINERIMIDDVISNIIKFCNCFCVHFSFLENVFTTW